MTEFCKLEMLSADELQALTTGVSKAHSDMISVALELADWPGMNTEIMHKFLAVGKATNDYIRRWSMMTLGRTLFNLINGALDIDQVNHMFTQPPTEWSVRKELDAIRIDPDIADTNGYDDDEAYNDEVEADFQDFMLDRIGIPAPLEADMEDDMGDDGFMGEDEFMGEEEFMDKGGRSGDADKHPAHDRDLGDPLGGNYIDTTFEQEAAKEISMLIGEEVLEELAVVEVDLETSRYKPVHEMSIKEMEDLVTPTSIGHDLLLAEIAEFRDLPGIDRGVGTWMMKATHAMDEGWLVLFAVVVAKARAAVTLGMMSAKRASEMFRADLTEADVLQSLYDEIDGKLEDLVERQPGGG